MEPVFPPLSSPNCDIQMRLSLFLTRPCEDFPKTYMRDFFTASRNDQLTLKQSKNEAVTKPSIVVRVVVGLGVGVCLGYVYELQVWDMCSHVTHMDKLDDNTLCVQYIHELLVRQRDVTTHVRTLPAVAQLALSWKVREVR